MAKDYDSGITRLLDALAEDYALPLAFESSVLKKIFEHISCALQEVCDHHSDAFDEIDSDVESNVINEVKEDKVTNALENELKFRILKDFEFRSLVTNVSRGSEVVDYKGKSISLRPDLHVLIKGNLLKKSLKISSVIENKYTDMPIIIEAKIINNKEFHRKIEKYYSNGILRFEEGQYAWYYQEAGMIAYVRDSSDIDSCLTAYLEQKTCTTDPSLEHVHGYSGIGELATAQHSRLSDIKVQGKTVGPITLWHLWIGTKV